MQLRNQLFLLFFFILFQAKSQNLVPNPSFENATNLPCSCTIGPPNDFNSVMANWIMPTYGTSDIFSTQTPISCYSNCFSTVNFGSQAPRTGTNMCGFFAFDGSPSASDYREYLQVKLTTSLIIGQKYYAEIYVSAADKMVYGCDNLGMYFSTSPIGYISSMGTLHYVPQIKSDIIIVDTLNWVKISGTFIANTAAEYLTIGNFYINATTSVTRLNNPQSYFSSAYYYIDDVLVKPICSAVDTSAIICAGSSIDLNLNDNNVIGWSLESSPTSFLSSSPIYTVSPLVSTVYLAHYACGETTKFEVNLVNTPETVHASINDPGWTCADRFPLLFSATATTTGTSTLHYRWSITDASGTATIVGRDRPDYSYTPAVDDDNKTVKVVVTTSSGCNTGAATSNSVTLHIIERITPTISITASNNKQCIGGMPITFTASQTGGGISPKYVWCVIRSGLIMTELLTTDVPTYTTSTLVDGDLIFVELISDLPCMTNTNPYTSNVIPIIIKPAPTPSIVETNQTICSPNTLTFHGNVGAGTSLQWKLNDNPITPNGNNSTYTPSQSGIYTLNEDNGICNSTSTAVSLTIIPTPIADAGPDIYTVPRTVIHLNGNGGSVYRWSPISQLSNPEILDPEFKATETITYTLTVSDPSRTCSTSDDITIIVMRPIKVPNVITVNGDGLNDDWKIEHIEEYPNIDIEIFNRWGNLVWKIKSNFKNWDGTNYRNGEDLPEGTYYYVIKPNNIFYDEIQTGWIQLIR